MTKAKAKQIVDIILFWVDGGTLWKRVINSTEFVRLDDDKVDFNYDPDLFVMEDRHFEARKAYALGEKIEVLKEKVNTLWVEVTHNPPRWHPGRNYRPVKVDEEFGVGDWIVRTIKPTGDTHIMHISKVGKEGSKIYYYGLDGDYTTSENTTLRKWEPTEGEMVVLYDENSKVEIKGPYYKIDAHTGYHFVQGVVGGMRRVKPSILDINKKWKEI